MKCTSFMPECIYACVCVFVSVVTCPVRLWMNGLPHWEQQGLFLALDSIVGLIVCKGGEEWGGYQSNQGEI